MVQRAAGVDAAAAGQDDGALAAEQALRAVLGVLEGDAGAQHVVQPGFQGAGDAEVVHRRRQDQHVRCQQFFGQQIGALQRGGLAFAVLIDRLHPATQQIGVQVRHLLDSQVADGDLVGRMGGLPLGEEVAGQLAGNGTFLTGTAFDNQDAGHGFDLHRSLAAME
ncbi:hypothetical protein D3C78_1421140 [compost metagenome]